MTVAAVEQIGSGGVGGSGSGGGGVIGQREEDIAEQLADVLVAGGSDVQASSALGRIIAAAMGKVQLRRRHPNSPQRHARSLAGGSGIAAAGAGANGNAWAASSSLATVPESPLNAPGSTTTDPRALALPDDCLRHDARSSGYEEWPQENTAPGNDTVMEEAISGPKGLAVSLDGKRFMI